MLVTLRILRNQYECNLPVQIFTFAGEIKDRNTLDELKDLNAEVKEVRNPIQF